MTPMEIWAVAVMCMGTVILLSVLWKLKHMKRREIDDKFVMAQAERKAQIDRDNERERQRILLRQHPNYNNSRFNPDFSTADKILATVRTRGTQTQTQTQTQTVSSNSVGVQSNNDVDWLTPALILATMNSSSGRVSAKVDNDIGSVTFKEEPAQESSYSSSSSNDNDSKSSYSSSYSSSSDDSSYSSGGSDSSYSSSYSSD